VVRCSSRRIEGCEAHLCRRRADVTQAEITAAKAEIRPNLPTRSAKTAGSWPARRAEDEMLRSTKRVAASSPALPRRRRGERVLFLWPVVPGVQATDHDATGAVTDTCDSGSVSWTAKQ
jgi:hypothetical protein